MRPDREATLRRAQARVGTTLKGKWTLDCLVGLGGMAAVYAATHRNRKRVAVKILHPELSLHPSLSERFQREGYVANTVKHPGVVSVDDDDVTEDGCAFLVMELVEGETLETRLERRGPLTVREVLAYASQVLDTLATAHMRGVVHRDIKPDNLLLGANGVVKILDFGISHVREPSTGSTHMPCDGTMGTPAFMAPEQARGHWEEVDAQSDLWAVGATVFTLLTGHYVNTAETANEALTFAMTERPPSPRKYRPDLDDDVVQIVERALDPDKTARWPDAPTMLRAVREAYYARERGPGASSRKPPESDRAPRVAWHRALEESWLSSDDRDTLETMPRAVDMAGAPDVSGESAQGPATQVPPAGPSTPSSRPGGAGADAGLANPPSFSSPDRAAPTKAQAPGLSRHAHTMTPRAVAEPRFHTGASRWSLALTFLGVVLVVASVVFTVRRSQSASQRKGELSTPAASRLAVAAARPALVATLPAPRLRTPTPFLAVRPSGASSDTDLR